MRHLVKYILKKESPAQFSNILDILKTSISLLFGFFGILESVWVIIVNCLALKIQLCL